MKEVLKQWLLFDLFLAAILWAALGTEGMAQLYCDFVNDPRCELLE
jgi:hypothetical protein